MTDQVFNINDIFDKIKDEASPLRGTLENEISNEVNEIKSLRYFEVPKWFIREPGQDPVLHSRYVNLLNMLTKK